MATAFEKFSETLSMGELKQVTRRANLDAGETDPLEFATGLYALAKARQNPGARIDWEEADQMTAAEFGEASRSVLEALGFTDDEDSDDEGKAENSKSKTA